MSAGDGGKALRRKDVTGAVGSLLAGLAPTFVSVDAGDQAADETR